MLREPALPASAAMDGGAQAASRERRPWMAGASVRRRGTGDPEATFESRIGEAQRASYLWATRRRGRQKFRRSSEAPRHSSSVRRSPPRLRAGKEAQGATLGAAARGRPKPQSGKNRQSRESAKAHATRRGRPRSSRGRGSSSGRADRRRPSRIPSVAPGPRSRQTPPAARSERLGANRASAGDTARG